MKNVTITMDDDLYRITRVEAAKAGKSMSRHIADKLRQPARLPDPDEERRLHLEALERFFAGPKLSISENGRMPTAEERNARR
jgi:hypothetical protein